MYARSLRWLFLPLFAFPFWIDISPNAVAAHSSAPFRTLPLCGTRFPPGPPGSSPLVLRVGTRPLGTVVSARTGHAFVDLSGTNGIGGALSCRSSVTTFDPSTGRFIRSVPVGAFPPSMALDDRDGRLFVTGYTESAMNNRDLLTLTVLNTNGTVVVKPQTFSACPCASEGGRGNVQIYVDGPLHRVFVVTYVSVITFDALTARRLNTVPVDSFGAGGGPGVGIDGRTGHAFVATASGVTVLNARTGAVVQTINLGQSERTLALDQQTGRVFVAGTGTCRSGETTPGSVTTLDSKTGKPIRSVLRSCLDLAPLLVDEPARRVLFGLSVTSAQSQYAVLDAVDGRVLRTLTLSSPLTPSAVESGTGRIYFATSTCSGRPTRCAEAVKVLDPNGWRIVGTVKLPYGSLTIDQRIRRVISTTWSSGTVAMAPTLR